MALVFGNCKHCKGAVIKDDYDIQTNGTWKRHLVLVPNEELGGTQIAFSDFCPAGD